MSELCLLIEGGTFRQTALSSKHGKAFDTPAGHGGWPAAFFCLVLWEESSNIEGIDCWIQKQMTKLRFAACRIVDACLLNDTHHLPYLCTLKDRNRTSINKGGISI